MPRTKTPFTLTPSNIASKANEIVFVLRTHSKDEPCPADVLCEATQLTKGQLSTVIKYMRRCSCENLDKFIPFYPVSSKKGYFLPSNSQDFIECYITLEAWVHSLEKTITPMRLKMVKDGVDWTQYKNDNEDYSGNYLNEILETNKDTSWFMDE